MAEYWYDSLRLAFGSHPYLSQWGGFAPFYKYYFLAPFFRMLYSDGHLSDALSLIILSNLLLYGISSYVFYLMAQRLISNKAIALMALMFYAFSYLAVYVNALVLPDSLAISMEVISTGIVIMTTGAAWVLLAGLLLGIAIAAKPFFLLYGFIFMWYVFSKNDQGNRAWKVMIFTLALVMIPLMTLRDNYLISNGKLKSLAAIGGSNFFQGWGRVGVIKSVSPEGNDSRISPGALDEPNWRPFQVKEPWYHQGYFYRLGLGSILRDPGVLLEKIFWFKKFFWGILGPRLDYPWGAKQILPVAGGISYAMFVSLGLLCFFMKRGPDSRTLLFLYFLLASFFIFIYAFGLPERRYFLTIEFLVIALFFVTLDRMMGWYGVYKKEIWLYAFFLFSFFFCVPVMWQMYNKLF